MPKKAFDLTGQQFGSLTVYKFSHQNGAVRYWLCRCDCGGAVCANTGELRYGTRTHCGTGPAHPNRNRVDSTGQTFGLLTAVRRVPERGPNQWLFNCACGKTKITSLNSVKHGSPLSCGCQRSQDLTGQTFGMLTVLRRVRAHGWYCKCECGTGTVVQGSALRRGNTTSCGCKHTKFGDPAAYCPTSRTANPAYESFYAAYRRCNDPRAAGFENYGGRGIEFRFTTFEQFLEHVGPRPEGTWIERMDNNGHYEPGNVKWATPTEQAANKRPRRVKPSR
jgi:hypothetical protein